MYICKIGERYTCLEVNVHQGEQSNKNFTISLENFVYHVMKGPVALSISGFKKIALETNRYN